VSAADAGGPRRGRRHTLRTLRRLVPFLRPYAGRLAFGLVLVVAASAVGAVVPWVLRAAVDGLREGAPPPRVWTFAGIMLGAALVGGAMRYGMREILNGVSRPRRDRPARRRLRPPAHARRGGRRPVAHRRADGAPDQRPRRRPHGRRAGDHVPRQHRGRRRLRARFMLRIDARLTGLALLPDGGLPFVMIRLGRLVHDRFEDVQSHFGVLTTRAQENLAGTRVVRAYGQEAARSRGSTR
jgi:ATP-binding cassette subfamily B protein